MARRKRITDDGQDRVDDLAEFAKLKGFVRDSMGQHADWYKEAEECFAFVSGRSVKGNRGQWPGNSWQEMLDSGRQPIEFNRVGPIVDAVCGLEVNNRQEVKYLPRTQGDVSTNERLSSLASWAREQAHAEDEESDMFRNAVICGRGATETRLDFEEEPTGKIIVDCLDPLECGVDPGARKPSFSDRRYSWRVREVSTDEALEMFPGYTAIAINATWAAQRSTEDGGDWNKTDYPDETRPGFAVNSRKGMVRIVQIEWYEYESRMMVARPGEAEPEEMGTDSFDAFKKLNPDADGHKVRRRRYYKAFLGRAGVLEKVEIAAFQINWTTGKYDSGAGYHYGIVRPMRDPQMLANKTLSQVLHILNTNAKGGVMWEAGAVRDAARAEKDWADPSKSIALNEGGLGRIKERTPPPMPPALVPLQEFSITAFRDVTGMSVEMMGLADRDQPASLEYQRRQSAMTILAGLFSSLRLYRKHQGRTLLECLKLLPPGVLVRVLIDPEQAMAEYQQAMMQWQQVAMQAQQQGQEPPPQPEPPGAEFMKQTKRGEVFDPARFGLGTDARFDVIVDEAPVSPNQKEATWAALQPFMKDLPPQAAKIALKYSPLPETAAKELGEALEGGGGGDPAAMEAMQRTQQENEALKLKVQQLSDRSAVEMAKVQVSQQEAETDKFRAISDATQPNEMDELRQHIATLAANQQAIIAHLSGGTNAG